LRLGIDVIRRQQAARVAADQSKVQVVLGTGAEFARIVVDANPVLALRAYIQVTNHAALYLPPVGRDLPVQVEIGKVDEVVVVADRNVAVREIVGDEVHILIDAFDLPIGRLNSPIRKNDAVEIEVAARRYAGRTVVAAVSPVAFAVLVVLYESLVDPVPDESAGEDVMLVDDLPVISQVAGAVAHRMGVFDQDKRPVVMCLGVLLEIPVPPVHARMKIGMPLADFFDVALGFVLHRP
jgi:hypothetical protein